MRITTPDGRISVDLGDVWQADPVQPGAEHLGLYVRSIEHGIYMNVGEYTSGRRPLTAEGMRALLRDQNWGASIDAWNAAAEPLLIAGGSFEAEGLHGEIVIEVFVTDGRRVGNLAGPGPREVIAKLRPDVERLAATLRFE
jgi:hypothetical protein